MFNISIGKLAPSFCLRDSKNSKVKLEDFRGRWVILLFLSKENTPFNKRLIADFNHVVEELENLNTSIVVVNNNKVKDNLLLAISNDFKITLLSDVTSSTASVYGCRGMHTNNSKKDIIIRSTYLIDLEGRLVNIWKNPDILGHVKRIVGIIKEKNYLNRVVLPERYIDFDGAI